MRSFSFPSTVVGSLGRWVLALLCSFGSLASWAHPMPNSAVLLDVQPEGIAAELQLPLSELELAFGHSISKDPQRLLTSLAPAFRKYLKDHIHLMSPSNQEWNLKIEEFRIGPVQTSQTGYPYQELTVHVWLSPPANESVRAFTLHYDVIIHQVVTHTILVSLRKDWQAGKNSNDLAQVGVIRLDVPTNTIPPLVIDLGQASSFTGFTSMVKLGMEHILEGTDHLLFLLVLLLPAPLLLRKQSRGVNRWGAYGGLSYTLINLLKIVSAFTLGHSFTLLVGAAGWVHLPSQPIEMLIAVSILFSAIHALRPLFSGREALIALLFGLIHGLAFAETLASLELSLRPMVLSMLGFNIGIELMQLTVVALTMPWLIILSKTRGYFIIRIGGALLAMVAALGWLLERMTSNPNQITIWAETFAVKANYALVVLAIVALLSLIRFLPKKA